MLSCLGISLLASASAPAGEYHIDADLKCAECHTMHYSQSHTYPDPLDGSVELTNGSPTTDPPQGTMGSGGPYGKLLRHHTNDLCLSCHDGQPLIPDVLGTNTGGHARQAGGLTTDSAAYPAGPDYYAAGGHTLAIEPTPVGPPTAHPPGSGGSCVVCHDVHGTDPEPRLLPLRCTSCHDPHGSAGFRNLRDNYNNVDTLITSEATISVSNDKDVRIDLPTTPDVGDRVGAGFYSRENIYFNKVDTTGSDSPYGNFCALCHGRFHGTTFTNSASPFKRHPTESVVFPSGTPGDIEDTYANHTYRVQVMMDSNASTVTDFTGAAISCMSCHKAHGNKNSFGLIHMNDDGAATKYTEEGTDVTGEYSDLCRQCHTQGLP